MPTKLDMVKLTKDVKKVAKNYGAVLVGVAPIERYDIFEKAPKGADPRDFVPEAKAVISIAMPVLNPVTDAPAFLIDKETEMIPDVVKFQYMEMFYNRMGHFTHDIMLEHIGQHIGQFLQLKGFDAMTFPTTGMHPVVEGMTDKEIWEGHSKFGYTFGPFSHRHTATRAGLGEFGYNNIVLTKEFGPRQRFNSIITTAPLIGDPLITEPICLRDKCNLCLKACDAIAHAITMRDDKEVRDYRSVDSVDKTKIFIDTPAKSDPRLCRRRREEDSESPVRGNCSRVCPIPFKRNLLPKKLQAIVEKAGVNLD